MARGRSNNYTTQRDASVIASYNLLRSILSRPLVPFGDRRSFHPEGYYRPADVAGRRAARFVVLAPAASSKRRSSSMPSDVFKFAQPNRVLVCGRRQVRKEVLFAKRKTGKGAKAYRDRNYLSNMSCR